MRYIQIPEQSSPRTQGGGPQVNVQAAGAPWQAVTQVGQAVASTGQFFSAYSQQITKANDEDYMTRWNTEARRAQRRISEAIANEPDESKWEKIADRELRSIKIDQKGASRQGIQRGQSFFNDFREREITRIHGQALKQDAQRKAQNKENEIEELVRDGDLDAVSQTINGAVEAGIFSREVADQKLLAARERVTYYEVTALIEEDPQAAAEALSERTEGGKQFKNFKDLRPDSRRTLTGTARQKGIDEQRQVLTELVMEAERGEPRGHESIVELMEAGKITPWHAKQYRQSYLGDRGQPGWDPARYASTMREIDNYDPHADTEREEFTRLMGSLMGLPSTEVGILRRRLEGKLNPASQSNRYSTSEAWDRIDSLYESGVFGSVEVDPIDGRPMNPEQHRQANEQWLKMKDEFDRFLDREESPTRLEMNQFLNGLLREAEDVRNIRMLNESKSDPEEKEMGFFRRLGTTPRRAFQVMNMPFFSPGQIPDYITEAEGATIEERARRAVEAKGSRLEPWEADELERRFAQ